MNKIYTISDWKIAIDDQLDPNDLNRELYMNRIEKAYEFEVPVIINIDHLASLLGLKVGVVTSMIYSPESFYRSFEIPKRKGGVRQIVAPYTSLLEAQRWINKEILSKFELHKSAYAYRQDHNIVLNAKEHLGNKYMLKLDLNDFFGNIRIGKIRWVFKQVGYDREISFYLAGLCALNESLPQGGATSPSISNIILRNLDEKFDYMCDKYQITYTRYADDLVFSSNNKLHDVVDWVGKLIEVEGFTVNRKKSRLYSEGANKLVTGLSLCNNDVRLPKRKRRKIRQEVYFLKNNGILKALEKGHDLFIVERVLGKLYFWKQVEPENEYVNREIFELKKMRNEFIASLSTSTK